MLFYVLDLSKSFLFGKDMVFKKIFFFLFFIIINVSYTLAQNNLSFIGMPSNMINRTVNQHDSDENYNNSIENHSLADQGDYSLDKATDYNFADSWALSVPADKSRYMSTLVEYLTSRITGDREKARVIYRWIGANIDYDMELFNNLDKGSGKNRTAEETFLKRSAVCGGYASLFKKMCEFAGLECQRISGPSLTFNGEIGHAWNAVKIDNKWRLVDATWASGYVKNGKFVRLFKDMYFLTPANHFIYSHFPNDSKWQLLKNKISIEDFKSFVKPRVNFFVQGFSIEGLSNIKRIINTEDRATIKISVPRGYEILASLLPAKDDSSGASENINKGSEYDSDDIENSDDQNDELKSMRAEFAKRVFCEKSSWNDYNVRAWLPSAGNYYLRIFSGPEQESDKKFVLEYVIKADSGISMSEIEAMQRITPNQAFFDLGYDIADLSHDKVGLSVQEEVSLTLDGPENVELMVTLSPVESGSGEYDNQSEEAADLSNMVFAQAQNGTYTIRAFFPAEREYKLSFFGKKNGTTGTFPFLFSYKVDNQIALEKGRSLPVLYTLFNKKKCFLNSPAEGTLAMGDWVNFDLNIPEAEDAAVVIDGKWTHLSSDSSGGFTGNVNISGSDIMVYAKFPGAENFGALLKLKGLE